MVNINKIHIFIINNPDISYLLDLDVFDCYEVDYGIFIGLAIDSNRLRNELDGIFIYSSYGIANLDQVDEQYQEILTPIIIYCGIDDTIDEILDIMLDEDVDINRRFYLQSILYFKSNQKGKKVNSFNLKVKHFDDFVNQFSEDIISYEIISNNEDFSETIVIIETCLTDSELNKKFNKFLIH